MVNFVRFEHAHRERAAALAPRRSRSASCRRRGRVRGRARRDPAPGEAVAIPPNVPHGARRRSTDTPRGRRLPPAAAGLARRARRLPRSSKWSSASPAAGRSSPAARRGSALAIARELVEEGVQRRDLRAERGRRWWRRPRSCAPAGRPSTRNGPTSPIPSRCATSSRAPPRRSAASTSSSTTPAARIPARFETLTDEDWNADLDVKLFSLIRCSREALPHLRAAGGGRIVNIGAVYGALPRPRLLRHVGQPRRRQLVHEDARARGGEGQHPRERRQHRLRRSRRSGTTSTSGGRPSCRARSSSTQLAAAEVPLGRFGTPDEVSGHRRVPAQRRGRATSRARRSTSPAAWASTSRALAGREHSRPGELRFVGASLD